jgi:hypothetical protein
MKTRFWSFFLIPVLFTTCGAKAERWDLDNDPSFFDYQFTYRLKDLPVEGVLSRLPWSDTYWPSNQGSINVRWNQEHPTGFSYDSPDREELLLMPKSEIAKLAPSEKYDIFMGRYSYPLRREVSRYANPFAVDWAGICDGWSIAAIQYAEPQVVEVKNPDGIVVPFGSSDIKGLMSFSVVAHFRANSVQVGLRCALRRKLDLLSPCGDVNAGSLHIVLANELGIKKEPFIVEVEQGREVWNQPAFGFKAIFLGSAVPEDGVSGVLVHSTLWYSDELDHPEWEPVTGTTRFQAGKLDLDYILDLDQSGNVIGGEYVSSSRHPDFIWKPTRHLEFKGSMDGVNSLYLPVPLK